MLKVGWKVFDWIIIVVMSVVMVICTRISWIELVSSL